VLAVLACAAPAAEAGRVDAGTLKATVSSDPWHLDFGVLSESRSRGAGPSGSLGFATVAGWAHATRVVSEQAGGEAYEATLETTEPGRQMRVRLAPDGDGVIVLRATVTGSGLPVTRVGMGFDTRPGERYLGFGERSNAVDQRGREVENYVSDGPYTREDRVLVSAFVPPWGLRAREDATYFPVPWLLSTAGYGVLLGNHETSLFRLGSDRADTWSAEAEAATLELRVVAGPRPADAVARLTRLTGRQPPPAAPWIFGPTFQPTGPVATQLEQAQRLVRSDVPTSAANTYRHYLPCGDQQGKRAEDRRRTDGMHGQGIAVTTYFNPMVCTSYPAAYDRAAAGGLLTRNALGQPYLYRYSANPDDLFLVGQVDFSAPGASAFYGGLLGEAVDDGYDGWMEDFGEYTPPDSRSANGAGGESMHNLYPTLYHRASGDFQRRRGGVAAFGRSGWTGAAAGMQMVWGGDPTVDWGFDGLSSAVTQALTMGTSGVSRWGSDIGGFFALGSRRLTPELLTRWIQFGAVSGVMRTQAEGVAVPDKPRPQIGDPEILPTWRRYAKLRTQLYPYLLAADRTYRRTGLPLMRHLALTDPGDPTAATRDDQFMFGPDLLAAPVTTPGARTRRLYLPRGDWVDLWRAVTYRRQVSGGLRLERAGAVSGGRFAELPAPLDELPLMARAGTVLALLPANVDTLAGYGRGAAVRLADRPRRYELLAFPRGRSRSEFGATGRTSSRERRRRWDLRLTGERRSSYVLQASMTTLRRPFRPRCVRLGRKRLTRKRWSYDRRSGVLRARIPVKGRTAVLSVRPRC